MAIYEITKDRIQTVAETKFSTAGVRERTDLQRLLREQIDIVSPETLVIGEEFGDWEDSRRRIDLLGLDKEANLVVIELKRTDDGGHMELQALRYAYLGPPGKRKNPSVPESAPRPGGRRGKLPEEYPHTKRSAALSINGIGS